jgi:hypothetical protein
MNEQEERLVRKERLRMLVVALVLIGMSIIGAIMLLTRKTCADKTCPAGTSVVQVHGGECICANMAK